MAIQQTYSMIKPDGVRNGHIGEIINRFERAGLTIDFENDVPALFTGDPNAIMKAIENKDFDAKAYRVFENANVTLPKSASCTETICEAIISAATSCEKNS